MTKTEMVEKVACELCATLDELSRTAHKLKELGGHANATNAKSEELELLTKQKDALSALATVKTERLNFYACEAKKRAIEGDL